MLLLEPIDFLFQISDILGPDKVIRLKDCALEPSYQRLSQRERAHPAQGVCAGGGGGGGGAVREGGVQDGFLPELRASVRARAYSLHEYSKGAYCALGAGNTMGCEAGAVSVLGRGEEVADSGDVDWVGMRRKASVPSVSVAPLRHTAPRDHRTRDRARLSAGLQPPRSRRRPPAALAPASAPASGVQQGALTNQAWDRNQEGTEPGERLRGSTGFQPTPPSGPSGSAKSKLEVGSQKFARSHSSWPLRLSRVWTPTWSKTLSLDSTDSDSGPSPLAA